MRQRTLSLVFFFVFTIGTIGLVVTLPDIFNGLARRLPENYTLPYKEAMSRGDFKTALTVAERRIDQAYYDLNAYYLKAEALAALHRPADAVATIETIFARWRAASGRIAQAGGYSEERSWRLLSANLWDAGREEDAVDIFRMSLDQGDALAQKEMLARARMAPSNRESAFPAAEIFSLTKNANEADVIMSTIATQDEETSTRAAGFLLDINAVEQALDILTSVTLGNPISAESWSRLADLRHGENNTTQVLELTRLAGEATGVSQILPSDFSTKPIAVKKGSTLEILRTGEVSATVQPSAYGASRLLVRLSGTAAIGVSPLVKFVINDKVQRYVYIDRGRSQTEVIEFAESPQTQPVSIKLEFVNDAFDPVTKDDRNVSILNAWVY